MPNTFPKDCGNPAGLPVVCGMSTSRRPKTSAFFSLAQEENTLPVLMAPYGLVCMSVCLPPAPENNRCSGSSGGSSSSLVCLSRGETHLEIQRRSSSPLARLLTSIQQQRSCQLAQNNHTAFVFPQHQCLLHVGLLFAKLLLPPRSGDQDGLQVETEA